MSTEHHHGHIIKEYRDKRNMSQAMLAEYWPTGPVNVRYIQRVESGEKQIVDQHTLRQLSEILEIPLWQFGLSEYNPFSPESLPGYGKRMHQETLDNVENLVQQTWYLRQVASLPESEKSVRYLTKLFDYYLQYLPPPSQMEPRFLRLYAQVQSLNGVTHVERKRYDEAQQSFLKMLEIAKQLGEPTTLAHALMNTGTELGRAGQKQEAVNLLEEARDVSFETSRQVAALINAYLARAYASIGDALRFQRAIDTAQTLAAHLKKDFSEDSDFVFHTLSGILAERSYGYLEINEPKKTLAMQEEIARQIKLDYNTRLEAWMPLDYAKAYFMLQEIEESVKYGLELLHRALSTQSPHIVTKAYDHLITLEEAGYADIKAVQNFREELDQAQRRQKK